MRALGRYNAVAATVPREDGFSKPGTRSEERAGSARLRSSRIQHAKIFGRKMLEAVAPTPEVIQKNNVLNVQLLDEVAGLHDPRKICRPHPAVDDRSGNAKPCGGNGFASEAAGRLAREFLDDELEVRELLAGEALLEDGSDGATSFRAGRQIILRPANISCQDHRLPPCSESASFSMSDSAATGLTS